MRLCNKQSQNHTCWVDKSNPMKSLSSISGHVFKIAQYIAPVYYVIRMVFERYFYHTHSTFTTKLLKLCLLIVRNSLKSIQFHKLLFTHASQHIDNVKVTLQSVYLNFIASYLNLTNRISLWIRINIVTKLKYHALHFIDSPRQELHAKHIKSSAVKILKR